MSNTGQAFFLCIVSCVHTWISLSLPPPSMCPSPHRPVSVSGWFIFLHRYQYISYSCIDIQCGIVNRPVKTTRHRWYDLIDVHVFEKKAKTIKSNFFNQQPSGKYLPWLIDRRSVCRLLNTELLLPCNLVVIFIIVVDVVVVVSLLMRVVDGCA